MLLVSAAGALADAPASAGSTELFERLDANHNGFITPDEVKDDSRAMFERLLRKSDANHDGKLSREEFLRSLVPSRSKRPVETKRPTDNPGADAVRYMLLKLDADKDSRIEKDEVPKQLRPTFGVLLERLDDNGDGQLDRRELTRSGPGLAQIAARYVVREGIDLKTELPKLEKAQGAAADRFDDTGNPLERLADPAKARQLFKELDANNDHYLSEKEVSAVLRERADRFTMVADRNRDGKLSENEFLAGAERISRFMNRQMKDERKDSKAKKNGRKARAATDSGSAEKK